MTTNNEKALRAIENDKHNKELAELAAAPGDGSDGYFLAKEKLNKEKRKYEEDQ